MALIFGAPTQCDFSVIIEGSNITLNNVLATGTITIQNSSFVTLNNCIGNISVIDKKIMAATTALAIMDSDHITVNESTFVTNYYRLIPDHIKVTIQKHGNITKDDIIDELQTPLYTECYANYIAKGLPVDVKVIRSSHVEFKHCEIGISNLLQYFPPHSLKLPIITRQCHHVTLRMSTFLFPGFTGVDSVCNDNTIIDDTSFHFDDKFIAGLIIYRAWKRYRVRIRRPVRVSHTRMINELYHKPPSSKFHGGQGYYSAKHHFETLIYVT